MKKNVIFLLASILAIIVFGGCTPSRYTNPTEEDIPQLIAEIQSADGRVTGMAAASLSLLPDDAKPAAVESLIELVENMQDKPVSSSSPYYIASEGAVFHALHMLRPHSETAVPALMRILDFQNEELRQQAFYAVITFDTDRDEVYDVVLRALNDSSETIRYTIASTLDSDYNTPEIAAAIVHASDQTGTMFYNFQGYHEYIDRIFNSHEECALKIVELLDSEDTAVRIEAVEALGILGHFASGALPKLKEMLETSDVDEEISALQEAIEDIEESVEDSTEDVEEEREVVVGVISPEGDGS